jgi:hypothetical protein
MRVFGCIAYAMVPDEKRGKLDAKGTKCLFLGYCEGTKAYRLMCVQSKKIIKCRDVEFMEDNTSVGNDLEMHPSERNETPNAVIVDTCTSNVSKALQNSSKAPKAPPTVQKLHLQHTNHQDSLNAHKQSNL